MRGSCACFAEKCALFASRRKVRTFLPELARACFCQRFGFGGRQVPMMLSQYESPRTPLGRRPKLIFARLFFFSSLRGSLCAGRRLFCSAPALPVSCKHGPPKRGGFHMFVVGLRPTAKLLFIAIRVQIGAVARRMRLMYRAD